MCAFTYIHTHISIYMQVLKLKCDGIPLQITFIDTPGYGDDLALGMDKSEHSKVTLEPKSEHFSEFSHTHIHAYIHAYIHFGYGDDLALSMDKSQHFSAVTT